MQIDSTEMDVEMDVSSLDRGVGSRPTLCGLVRMLLERLGEDPQRQGLADTPKRVERTLEFLTRGYKEDAAGVLQGALFDVEYDEMVLVRDIELYSLCEHHLLPFFGTAHVAYIPRGKVIGISKVARVVEVYARRIQVQERLTAEIADAIERAIDPAGVAVVIEAKHLCMMMRGVQKQKSFTITSSMRGSFRNPQTRNEFLNLIANG